MLKRMAWVGLALLVTGALLAGGPAVSAGPLRGGAILYESRPDEAALYLSDIAFVRDSVTLPAGQDIQVLLPPGTYPGTLVLTENGERVRNYRVTPQAAADVYSGVYQNAGVYVLTWEPNTPPAEGAMREIKLEYLLPGASWVPSYDMAVIDDSTVKLDFFAEIHNSVLKLDGATVYLVAGRVDLSQQLDQVPTVTMNQYAVGYSDENVALPALGVGAVNLQHVYRLEQVTAMPGQLAYFNLVDSTLQARRLDVWNSAAQQETDVIYKVMNDTDIPLAEGIVRIYQDNLFMGSDFIETTPVGSEGSVTVGSLPDVRVHRTQSQELQVGTRGDYYQYSVTLEINNYGEDTLDLIVLDTWLTSAYDFEYSLEPQREPNNTLRWEVSIPSGESLTITYRFRTEY